MESEQKYLRAEWIDIAEKLEKYLCGAGLAPHTRLPSVEALCKRFGGHRNTMRAALNRLAATGVIYLRKNSGAFVAPSKLRRNLLDFEALWYFAAQNRKSFTSRVLFAQAVPAPRAVSSQLKLSPGGGAFCLQRLRLLDDTPAILETTFLSAARFHKLEQFDFSQNSLFEVLSTEFNVYATEGAEHIGVMYADEREAQLLRVEEGTPLFSLNGVTQDDYDIPVEVFRASIRGDMVGFWSEDIRR